MWDLLRSGVRPMSPALTGKFFATEPPGKPPFTPGSLLLSVYHGPCRPGAKMFTITATIVHCPDPLFHLIEGNTLIPASFFLLASSLYPLDGRCNGINIPPPSFRERQFCTVVLTPQFSMKPSETFIITAS